MRAFVFIVDARIAYDDNRPNQFVFRDAFRAHQVNHITCQNKRLADLMRFFFRSQSYCRRAAAAADYCCERVDFVM